jgi:hypothetical protein
MSTSKNHNVLLIFGAEHPPTFESDYFTVILRLLILDPSPVLLRELQERMDSKAFLETLHANAEQNLHRKFPNITVQMRVDGFLRYLTGHNFRLEFVGLIFALARITSSYVSFILSDLDHCIEMIRINLLCQAHGGIIPFRWVGNYRHPLPDFSTKHKCRDWEGVLQ